MRGKLVYPYSDTLLGYEFRKDHPLKPERLKLTYLLSKELGLLDKVNVIDPTLAARDELELFHSNVPDQFVNELKEGWKMHYWKPWKQFIKSQS